MKRFTPLNDRDRELVAANLKGFLPDEVFDIHVHPFHPAHFGPEMGKTYPQISADQPLGCAEHRADLMDHMPVKTMHGLYFGLPHRTANRPAINAWVQEEVRAHGTPLSRALLLVSPQDDQAWVASELRSGRWAGLKVYHLYAGRPDTMNAKIEEYAPDWMWELLNEVGGVMTLHIVRDGAITDPDNVKSIRRLCRAYPKMRLILAHIARSFNYRNARAGLKDVADLDNVVVDTSAVAEADAFQVALKVLGPKRVLWGSDYFISQFRGRCVTTGSLFFWLSPDVLRTDFAAPTSSAMTLVGMESLICLREACDDAGLTRGDIDDIFLRNAVRLLAKA